MLLLASIGLAVLAIGWSVWAPEKKAPAEKVALLSEEDKKQLEYLDKDADSDGLKDWEELLWKTDPKNPDTDRDGTKDNEEVLAKRDPRKPAPGDEMLSTPAAFVQQATASSTENNFTKKLGEEFAAAYFQRKIASATAGKPLIGKDSLTDQFSANVTNTIMQEDSIDRTPKYLEKDFRSARNESHESTRAYINALGSLFQKASFPEKNDLEVISEAISNVDVYEDSQQLQDLSAYRDAYQKLAEDMKTIPVPKYFLEVHTRMANNFWRLGAYMDQIIQIQDDPVKGMASLYRYTQEGLQSSELLKVITSEIKSQNLTFSEQEGGAEFNKYLNI